ncbi:protoporphyrinogen oxidase HemJ [Catenovulum sp. SM1970]|uniref:protoporphyrinogen oxidase HemJ n=1 Tax=Marinifaba aquimaris TaxID=2741323 RepID=UPI00157494BF|nr:protoporphyrinogen oxidase HemJ [Marinifaba aquimaris]NTS78390.1 protoporphyrinogen oxidase HemJ [Marinifaba aquimaris]
MLWLKAFHIIFMVAWFAGIFYLPRLFIYHATNQIGNNEKVINEQFKIMERRLWFFVTPFAVLTAIFGFSLIYMYGTDWLKASPWMHAKLTLVALLYIYHGYLFKLMRDFQHDRNKHSPRFYRFVNESPVIVLFAIVILVVVKPF